MFLQTGKEMPKVKEYDAPWLPPDREHRPHGYRQCRKCLIAHSKWVRGCPTEDLAVDIEVERTKHKKGPYPPEIEERITSFLIAAEDLIVSRPRCGSRIPWLDYAAQQLDISYKTARCIWQHAKENLRCS